MGVADLLKARLVTPFNWGLGDLLPSASGYMHPEPLRLLLFFTRKKGGVARWPAGKSPVIRMREDCVVGAPGRVLAP